MSYTYPRLRDYFALSNQKESLSQETHIIRNTAPYAIDLFQIPQVRTTISTIMEDVWVDATTANTLLTIEIETSPSTWQAATIVASSSPSALQCYMQISTPGTYPFSPRVIFHSSHAGQSVRVTYTGWGSAPLASHITTIHEILERLMSSVPPLMLSQATYNGGWLDGNGVNDTTVDVLPSNLEIRGSDLVSRAVFPGITLDFGLAGNCEVGIFTNANYWKRILIEVDYDGSWDVIATESAESATQGALVTPDRHVQYFLIGAVDVQNDNDIVNAGAVIAITDAMISPLIGTSQASSLDHHEFLYDGTAIGGQDLDVPFAPGFAGHVQRLVFLVKDSGTSGTVVLDVLKCNTGTPAGSTILASTVTVTANANAPVLTTVEIAGIATQSFTANDWLLPTIVSATSDAEVISCTLYYTIG